MVWDVVHPTSCSKLVYEAYKPWTYPQQNHDKPHINQFGKQTHQNSEAFSGSSPSMWEFTINPAVFFMAPWSFCIIFFLVTSKTHRFSHRFPISQCPWPQRPQPGGHVKIPAPLPVHLSLTTATRATKKGWIRSGKDLEWSFFFSMGYNDKRGESTMEQTILIWYIIWIICIYGIIYI
jgi:hypothetical protein